MVGAFNEVLRSMGSQHTVTQSQADHLLQAIDSSSDGSIQKPEFFKMLKYLLDAPNDY
jgi:Ca2+-binding EF-hand superfamily protein